MRRIVRRIALAVVVLYVALVAAFFAVMHNPVTFGKVMRHVPEPAFYAVPYFKYLWFAVRAGHLKVGDPAPDFRLYTHDRKGQFELASFRGQKPVVLIFGSYT